MPTPVRPFNFGRHRPPSAVPLPVEPAGRRRSSNHVAGECPAAAGRDEYLVDYSHSEMARHRGFTGFIGLPDMDEMHAIRAAAHLPAK